MFGGHDRASVMDRAVLEPETGSRSGNMQTDASASSEPPNPSRTAARDHDRRIGCTRCGAAGEEGIRPHCVAIHALPDNHEFAPTQHRIKGARRDAKSAELGAANDAVVGA
jgi:hypothetical protein